MPPRKQQRMRRRRRGRRGQGQSRGGAQTSTQVSANRNMPAAALYKAAQLNVFSYRFRAHLRYAEEIEIKGYGVTPNSHTFSANGLYDPNITSTGHQPMGFDQLMVFYQHYTVVNARIHVQFKAVSTTTIARCAVAVQRNSSALTDWSRLIEAGNVQFGNIGAAENGGGPLTPWFIQNVRIANFQAVPNVLNDDTLRGTAAANPATGVFFVLYVATDATESASMLASVTIEYDAFFTEPLQPSQS